MAVPISSLDIVRKQFEKDAFAKVYGIVLDDLTETTIRMHMQLRADMLNLFQRPHGGAIYALADAAFSVLANNSNNISVALDCSISYHNSPEPDALLTVEGETLSSTRGTGVYLFKVFTPQNNTKKLIATMKATVYRTGKPIDPSGPLPPQKSK